MNNRFDNIITALILILIVTVSYSTTRNPSGNSEVLNPSCSYSIESIRFTNKKDGAELSGTLTIPNSNEKIPAVVLISGSGIS